MHIDGNAIFSPCPFGILLRRIRLSVNGRVAEWSIAHAWKACLPKGNVGSNPPPSAIFSRNAKKSGQNAGLDHFFGVKHGGKKRGKFFQGFFIRDELFRLHHAFRNGIERGPDRRRLVVK